jgi:hypothetical protein
MQVQTNLGKHAVLFSVNIVNGGLLGERKDYQASELVQQTYQVSDKRAKASKYLIDRTAKPVKRVIAASQRVREVVYRFTSPWGDEKMRLVTTRCIDEFRVNLAKAIKDLEDAWDDYCRAYPDLKDQSAFDLGPLFDASQYPDADDVRALFKISTNYWPFPETGHFVAELSAKAASEATEGMEREIEERLIFATSDMVARAQKVVAEFIEKLEAVDTQIRADGNKTTFRLNGVIRDSIVDNIADTANLIERMNLTENAQIAKVVKDLKRLCVFNAEHWRKYPQEYKDQKPQALNTANEILAQLNVINVRDQEIAAMVDDGGEYLD